MPVDVRHLFSLSESVSHCVTHLLQVRMSAPHHHYLEAAGQLMGGYEFGKERYEGQLGLCPYVPRALSAKLSPTGVSCTSLCRSTPHHYILK